MPLRLVASPFVVSVICFLRVRVFILCQGREPELGAARDFPAGDTVFRPFPGAAKRAKGLENEGMRPESHLCRPCFEMFIGGEWKKGRKLTRQSWNHSNMASGLALQEFTQPTCRISAGLESVFGVRGAESESAENLHRKGVCSGCLFNQVRAMICLAREDRGKTRRCLMFPQNHGLPTGTEGYSPSAPGTWCWQRTRGVYPHTHLF